MIVISKLAKDILYEGIEFFWVDSNFKDVAKRNFHI